MAQEVILPCEEPARREPVSRASPPNQLPPSDIWVRDFKVAFEPIIPNNTVIEKLGFWNRFGSHSWNRSEMTEPVKCISWKPASPVPPVRDGAKQVSVFVVDGTDSGGRTTGQNCDVKKGNFEDVTTWKQIMGAITVSWLNFVIGYSTGFVSPAVASMNSEDSKFKVSENEISWIGSLMPLFALVGSSIGGFSLDKLGRKWTIILGGTPFVPSFSLTYFASKVWLVMVGRALSGLAIGLSTVAVPVYLGELTGPKVRGFYGLLPTTSGNLGILVVTILGLPLEWRTMALVGFFSIAPFFVLVFYLVESPVWTAQQKQQKLDNVIKPVGGGKLSEARCFSSGEDGYCKREYLLPFFICLGLHVVQQFCGINAVITYATQIFQGVNSSMDPLLCSVIVSIVNVLSTLLANFLVDKVGRKMLMNVSLVMLLIANLTLSVFYYCSRHGQDWPAENDWVPLFALALFILGFSLGAGPIPWLIIGEILPAKIRGTAASAVTAAHWVFTFAVTKTFVDISEKYGTHVPFACYGAVCLVGLFLMEIVPETAGRTLEEIQAKLRKREKDVIINPEDKEVTKVPPTS